MDSIFYSKIFLNSENLILKGNHSKLHSMFDEIKSFGAYSLNNMVEYQESGIPFIRGMNMKNGMINFNNVLYITEEANKLLYKSEVKPEMLLISMSGTIGDIAIAQKDWKYPINSNQDIAKIKINKDFNPYFIYAFFLGSYGQNQIIRESRGSVQQHVFLSQIENLLIPIFSNDFQKHIEILVKLAHVKLEESKKLYREAEEFLLKELGLNDFTPSNECVAVKSFSESFGMSGRLDAEYYQLKYDDIIGRIKSYQSGYKKLGAITTLKKSIEPGSDAYGDEGVQFLRVADLFKYELKEPEIRLSESLFDAEKLDELKPKKGEVLLSKDGSVGIAYAVREDTNFIPSGAIVRLQQISDILPDVLALILNSQVVQLQAERDAGGSILQHWKPSEINEVLVPLLNEKVQKMIAEKISESFSLRAESKKLLEQAKMAVEKAIEFGESNKVQ